MTPELERKLVHENIDRTFEWLRHNRGWNEALWFRALIRRLLATDVPQISERDVLIGLRDVGRFMLGITSDDDQWEEREAALRYIVLNTAKWFHGREDPVLAWLGGRPQSMMDFGQVYPRQSDASAALVKEAQREIALDASWAILGWTPASVIMQGYPMIPGRPLDRSRFSPELEVAWGPMANYLAGGVLLQSSSDRRSLEALIGGSADDWPPVISTVRASLRAFRRQEIASLKYSPRVVVQAHLTDISLDRMVKDLVQAELVEEYPRSAPLPANHGDDYARYFVLVDQVTAQKINLSDVEDMARRRLNGDPAFRHVGLGSRRSEWAKHLDDWLTPQSSIGLLQMLRGYPPDGRPEAETSPIRARVPPPTDRAPRLVKAADGRFDVPSTSTANDFNSVRAALQDEIAIEIPQFGSHQNAHPEVFGHLQRYQSSLEAGNVWRIWTAGNALRHDLEVNSRRERDHDPDRPALPHGLLGFLSQIVDGHNALMELHEIGRRLDAARPSPAQRQAALNAITRIGPVVDAMRDSPQVFTENSLMVIGEIVENVQRAQPDGLTSEQAALVAVDTINNSQQALLKDTEDAIDHLDPADLERLRAVIRETLATVRSDLQPKARRQFWPAFFAALGEQLATWTVRASVVSIGFVVFNAQQITAWLATGVETAGLRAAAIEILTKLGFIS